MEDQILWTDWRTQHLKNFDEYANLLRSFVKSRFGDREVEVNTEYQGPGVYRLKYWYNRPDRKPPLIELGWEGV